MGLALVVLLDLLNRSQFLEAHYTDDGVLPRDFMHRILWQPTYFCFHAWSGSLVWQQLLFVFAFGFALLLLLGYQSRWMIIMSWLLLVSLQNRNQYLLNGGDQLLRLLLFWAIFLPLGERYSIDARSKEVRKTNAHFSIATVGLLLQIAWMYLSAGISKIIVSDFSFENVRFMTDLAGPLFNLFLLLPVVVAKPLIFGQILFPLLLLIPYRNRFSRLVFIGAFALFHFANLLFFRLGVFSWVGLLGLLAIYPPSNSEANPALPSWGFKEVAAITLLFYVLIINIASVCAFSLPHAIMMPAYALRLDQRWNMFSGESMKQAVRVQLEGEYSNGEKIKLAEPYQSFRWRNYLYYTPFIHESGFKENVLRYVCDERNQIHGGTSKMKMVRILETRYRHKQEILDMESRVIFECACN